VGRPHIILQAGRNPDGAATWEADERLSIGRLPSCDVVLDDASISRRHAEVLHTDAGWIVRDLGSTNGTLLNGVRIGRVAQRLHQGDLLQPGKVLLTVCALQEDAPASLFTLVEPVGREPHAASQPRGLATAELPIENATEIGELAGVAAELSVAGDPLRDFLATSLRGAIASIGAQGGAVFLSDALAGNPVLKASWGAGFCERSTAVDATLIQRCFQQNATFLGSVRPTVYDGASHPPPGEGVASALCVPLQQARRAHGVLCFTRVDAHRPFSERDQVIAEAIATTVSAGIASADQLLERQRHLFMQTVLALAHAVDCRDPFSAGHTQRVTEYALLLAEEMQLSAADYHHLQIGTPLHDIGKLGIEDVILRKPGRLTPVEFAEVQAHPEKGVALLRPISELDAVLPIIASHHEHWDGSGYPDGLIGDIIPALARVVTVADVFDALTSDRPYRKALSATEAFCYVQRNAGTLFDPKCAHAFVRQQARVEKLLRQRNTPSPTVSKRELERLRASLQATGARRMARTEA
jgi:HD-GYP domain-containing protein (c-di-GMP phosphodiesterase class II)/pSer/pThr/pTyr-binding forkhead associated (FHA) protein